MIMRGLLIFFLCLVCAAQPLLAQIDSVLFYNNRAIECRGNENLIDACAFFEKAYNLTSDEMTESRIALAVNLSDALIRLAEYSKANYYISSAESMIGSDRARYLSLAQELDYQKIGLMMAIGDSKGALSVLEPLVRELQWGHHLYMPSVRALLEAYMVEERFDEVVFRGVPVMAAVNTSDSLYLSRIIARAYAGMDNKVEAERYLSLSEDVFTRLPADLMRAAQQKRLRADISARFKDYPNAYASYREAKAILSEFLSDWHPDCVSMSYGMAQSALMAGDAETAWKHYSEYLDKKMEYLSSQMFRMNVWEMQSYWKKSNEGLVDAPLFCHDVAVSGENLSKALNAVMFAKSVSLDVSVNFSEMVERSGDESIMKAFEDLRHFRMMYGQEVRLNQSTSPQTYKENKKKADILEGRIRRALYERGLLKDELTYPDWKRVASGLDAHTVAVEFVDFEVGDIRQYSAFIYRKGQKIPLYVPVCREDEIISVILSLNMYNDTSRDPGVYDTAFDALYDVVWKPLEPYFRKDDKVCFSPSGCLCQIPVEYLASGGLMFAEKYPLVRRVSVTKDIPYLRPVKEIDRVEAFGAMEYFYVEPSRAYVLPWAALPSSSKEMDYLELVYASKAMLTARRSSDATEESFRQMNLKPESNALLHLSTHGFYLPYNMAAMLPYYRTCPKDLLLTYPLLRCGLAMAGANRAWCGFNMPQGREDGILTAQEISEMDLRGASLVVLSACQTGLGDLGQDGVQGFQRAFRLAGAGSMMVSMWPVNDMGTMLLMRYFYTCLAEGMDAHKSLVAAVKTVKQDYPSARIYAPFVIVD